MSPDAPVFRVDAIAFDLDGVIIDSESVNVHTAFTSFASLGYVLDPRDAAEVVGRHPDDYTPRLAARFGLDEAVQARLRRLQNETYARLWEAEAILKDRADDVLRRLRGRGFRLALATSSGRGEVERALARFRMEGVFDVTLTKDDVARRKPDPEMYLACARRLGLPPAAMLVVEDSEYGVRAAKAAGTPCVAVRTPHTPPGRVAAADAFVDTLGEIETLVAR